MMDNLVTVITEEDRKHATLASLRFHIVGPVPTGSNTPRFEELDVPDWQAYSEFFLSVLRPVMKGNLLEFEDTSTTKELLATLRDHPGRFKRISGDLAREFSRLHVGSSADGLFMLMRISRDDSLWFVLAKIDYSEVVSIRRSGSTVTLQRLTEVITRDQNVLQKCAVIKASSGLPLISFERGSPNGTRYFHAFLGASRALSAEDGSALLKKAIKAAAKEIRGIDSDRAVGAMRRAADYLHNTQDLQPAARDEFARFVFGPDTDDCNASGILTKHCKAVRISEETIQPQRTDFQRRPPTAYIIMEGIRVIETREGALRDHVQLVNNDKRLVIESQQRIREGDAESD